MLARLIRAFFEWIIAPGRTRPKTIAIGGLVGMIVGVLVSGAFFIFELVSGDKSMLPVPIGIVAGMIVGSLVPPAPK